jgi:hypothetical protein
MTVTATQYTGLCSKTKISLKHGKQSKLRTAVEETAIASMLLLRIRLSVAMTQPASEQDRPRIYTSIRRHILCVVFVVRQRSAPVGDQTGHSGGLPDAINVKRPGSATCGTKHMKYGG